MRHFLFKQLYSLKLLIQANTEFDCFIFHHSNDDIDFRVTAPTDAREDVLNIKVRRDTTNEQISREIEKAMNFYSENTLPDSDSSSFFDIPEIPERQAKLIPETFLFNFYNFCMENYNGYAMEDAVYRFLEERGFIKL